MFPTIDQLITWGVCSVVIYLCLNFRLTIEMRYRANRARRRRNKATKLSWTNAHANRTLGCTAGRCGGAASSLGSDDPGMGSGPVGQGRGANAHEGEKVQQGSAGEL